MTKFIVNNRTDALKTNINLYFTITNCLISRSRSLTRRTNFKFMCLSALFTIKISQWARVNFCSYRKNMDWIVLLEYVASTDDVHINIFIAINRRLTCQVALSSSSQASRRSMLGIDYVTVSEGCRRHMKTRRNVLRLCARKQRRARAAYEKSSSFPGSLIFPPPWGAPGGGKKRDPGNELDEKFRPSGCKMPSIYR